MQYNIENFPYTELTEAFYLTGDIEKYGTGFSRIKKWFNDYPELSIDIKDLTNFIQVNVYKNNYEPVNNRQKQIINLLKSNSKITILELANKLNAGRETIKRDLKKLRELNIIKRIGPDKGGHWEVIK